jgi:chromosomal replication initiation ATPase DnaA
MCYPIHPYIYVGIHYEKIKRLQKKRQQSKKPITKEEILKIVSIECGVTIEDIKSKSRIKEIVDARFITYAAMKLKHKSSLKNIGKYINNSHHTSVINGLLMFSRRYHFEDQYRNMADKIFDQINVKYNGQDLTQSQK